MKEHCYDASQANDNCYPSTDSRSKEAGRALPSQDRHEEGDRKKKESRGAIKVKRKHRLLRDTRRTEVGSCSGFLEKKGDLGRKSSVRLEESLRVRGKKDREERSSQSVRPHQARASRRPTLGQAKLRTQECSGGGDRKRGKTDTETGGCGSI